MKHYYYLVRDVHQVSSETVIYTVTVGTSRREQAKLALMMEFCKDAGWFLQLKSDDSDKAVSMMANAIFGGRLFSRLLFREEKISITEAYNRTIDDSWSAREEFLKYRKSLLPILSCYGHISLKNHTRISPKKGCANRHTYDLSQPAERDCLYATIGFGLILILFLVGARIDYLYF